jgi:lipopolysaccharide export LptBFGC system permease protein LptF
LLIPNHLYELLPISVLIGTIFVMARLAQSSEYTILRTSGLGPWRALKLLLALGALFVVFSFAIGDYVAPASERAAQLLKARYQNKITIGQTGAWLKEKQAYNTYVVNVKTLSPDNEMQGVQVFEFNNKGLVVSTTQAPLATFAAGDAWLLHKAVRAEFEVPAGITGTGKPQGRRQGQPDDARNLSLADRNQRRDGVGGAAQARTHGHHRPLQLRPPPGRQRPDRPALRNRILEKGVLPAQLPGDGDAGPALCLPALPLGRHCRLRLSPAS